MTGSTSPGASSSPTGRLIYRGAEADLIRGDWLGLDAVFKIRRPLRYRLEVLDESIRRQRTVREAEMIHRAKEGGVEAPYLYEVDVPGSTLVMEYVAGERLRDQIRSAGRGWIRSAFQEFGRSTALLHAAGVVHGDLTTANVISRDGRLVFIDFGLSFRSERLEDHAVDIRLIKETLVGAHPDASSAAMAALVDGYRAVKGVERTRAVLRQLQNIERRGRYARVV